MAPSAEKHEFKSEARRVLDARIDPHHVAALKEPGRRVEVHDPCIGQVQPRPVGPRRGGRRLGGTLGLGRRLTLRPALRGRL